MGLLDVQQRQADVGPDVHPRTGHLDEARVHQQLDPGTLERPGELPEVAVPGGVAAGDGDGVRTVGADQLGHLLAEGECYQDPGTDYYTRLDPIKTRNNAINKLKSLGYNVTITPATAA